MGSSTSKPEATDALHLCKARMRFIKQAVDSRYALSAAHLAYIQSLRSTGTSLYRFVEAELVTESSLSTTSELDKSPSRYSYASVSPPHLVENANSGPLTPKASNVSYMRSGVSAVVTVELDLSPSHSVGDESLSFSLPPPPPPPPEIGSSWDFFDPADVTVAKNVSTLGKPISTVDGLLIGSRKVEEEDTILDEVNAKLDKVHPMKMKQESCHIEKGSESGVNLPSSEGVGADGTVTARTVNGVVAPSRKECKLVPGQSSTAINNTSGCSNSSQSRDPKREKTENEKEQPYREREDPSEYITHRAKDLLSSTKDIEHWFFRAADSGTDLSKMLEANKIRLNSYLKKITGRSTTICAPSIHASCCRKGTSALDQNPVQNMTKVITWNRSVSSLSSSSRIPLVSPLKDECDSISEFSEHHCMISGSHSSSLDRLYAWERKLYDEVNVSEAIRKQYERRCYQLRQQFARDMNARVIDKTRAIVKDLHSQLRVALQTVDSISKRIEKLRDEELLPQLAELVQGLIGMWKAMLTCHHTQYIIISLAYQMKGANATTKNEHYRQVLANLLNETTCFASSFGMLMSAQKGYVEALNAWLQNCILQPQERSRGRRAAFSPRRAIAPPIFVLCRDWSSRINALPSEDLSEAISALVLEIQVGFSHPDKQKGSLQEQAGDSSEPRNEKQEICCQNLADLQACLTRVFDQLRKFAEASLKMYEEIKESFEAAHVSYTNGWIRFKA